MFGGRTALEIYHDFFASFASEFSSLFGNSIVQVEIGMGPAGELRYPSYQVPRDSPQSAYWTFPGIGEFQFYDKYMSAQLLAAANAAGEPSWAAGPSGAGPLLLTAGNYNDTPQQTQFFTPGTTTQNFQSTFGQWFLTWYSQALITHGDAVLSQAQVCRE